jgi:hypothetical protein
MGATYKYIQDSHPLANESGYPYTGSDDTCYYDTSMGAGGISGFTFLTGGEEELMWAVANIGPIAVGFKGDLDSFYYYGSGIYNDQDCRGGLNHAVCLIGGFAVEGCEF